ncbi:hypothetical protein Tco_1506731 [Tanacetum coccineum]
MCDDGSSSSHLVFLPRAGCDIGNDKEWDIALEKSTITATTSELSFLFVQILIYCEVADPPKKQYSTVLENHDRHGLPTPPRHLLEDLENKLPMEEKNYRRELLMQEMLQSLPKLNNDHIRIYDLIINATTNNQQELIFVYGHGE